MIVTLYAIMGLEEFLMQLVYIVSRFLQRKNEFNEFHFIGYYNGERINRIRVKEGEFVPEHDYVLALNCIEIKDLTLFGELIKYKAI